MAESLSTTLKPWIPPDRSFPVEKYGAAGDAVTDNTKAIQSAIDECSAAGGGVVVFAKGTYLADAIRLKSHVILQVEQDATVQDILSKSPRPPSKARSLLTAENCDDIGLRGPGTICGQGPIGNYADRHSTDAILKRGLIHFNKCRGVFITDVRLRSCGAWMQHYQDCGNLILTNVNTENQATHNNDGCDIDGCHNVLVQNCVINSEDDGLCFKSISGRDDQNILVENCAIYSLQNPLKFGNESKGGLKDIWLRNLVLGGPPPSVSIVPGSDYRKSMTGVHWDTVDGGVLENILCTNLKIDRVHSPIFLRLGNRGRYTSEGTPKIPGALRHIIFDGVTASGDGPYGSIIAGIPGAPVEDILFRNLRITSGGRGKIQKQKAEAVAQDPTPSIFKPESPAYGFWIRHARNILFFDTQINLEHPDARPKFGIDEDDSGILVDGAEITASR